LHLHLLPDRSRFRSNGPRKAVTQARRTRS
jgi:hypothetical protein